MSGIVIAALAAGLSFAGEPAAPDAQVASAQSPSAAETIARSAAAQAAGDGAKAHELAQQAAASAPKDAAALYQAASAALALKNYEEALAHIAATIKLRGETPALLSMRADAKLGLGKPAEALADAERALSINVDSARARLRRAYALEKLGRKEEALADYVLAAQMDPQYSRRAEAATARLGGAVKQAAAPAAAPAAAKPAPVVEAPVPEPGPVSEPAPAPKPEPVAEAPAAPLKLPRAPLAGAGAVAFVVLALIVRRRSSRSKLVRFGSMISMPAVADEPRSGQVLAGRYIVGRAVDRGPWGQLFEARDLEDQPLLLQRFAPTPDERRRFKLDKARAAQALIAPGLLPLRDAYEEAGWGLAFWPPRKGETLAETLEKAPRRRLAPEAVLAGVKSLCEGLEAAHKAGLAHGWICARAIRVTKEGWVLEGLGLPGASTADAAAPEGDAGTPEADLYSLAVCVYEALAGAAPFDGADAALAKREGRGAPLPKGALPHGLDAFFARALQPDPERRFRSASEVYLALRALVSPAVH